MCLQFSCISVVYFQLSFVLVIYCKTCYYSLHLKCAVLECRNLEIALFPSFLLVFTKRLKGKLHFTGILFCNLMPGFHHSIAVAVSQFPLRKFRKNYLSALRITLRRCHLPLRHSVAIGLNPIFAVLP